MTRVIIVINDPVGHDYSLFLRESLRFLHDRKALGANCEIHILRSIESSDQLNSILTELYKLLRAESNSLGYDYRLEFDIIFNVNYSEKNSSGINWLVYSHGEKHIIPASLVSEAEFKHPLALSIAIHERKEIGNEGKGYLHAYFNTCAVGGTFDHIHDGHKILLSMSMFLSKSKLIIGITGTELLKNKRYSEVLKSYQDREKDTLEFVGKINSRAVVVDTYEINDVCGPTGYIKEIDALVVSAESVRGGHFINDERKKKHFPPLDIVCIKVIGEGDSNENNNWAGKLSSTDIRRIEYEKRFGKKYIA